MSRTSTSKRENNMYVDVCGLSDQEEDETEKQVARCKPEGLDALCRTTKFSRKELQIMYRGFKNVTTLSTASNINPL